MITRRHDEASCSAVPRAYRARRRRVIDDRDAVFHEVWLAAAGERQRTCTPARSAR
jgi:hypothetical protein